MATTPDATGSGILPPERDQLVPSRDGRVVAVAEWGPLTGSPIVYLSGSPNVRLQAFGEAVLGELNVRLVVPQRPGYGDSTPLAGRGLLDWPPDLASVADELGLDTFAIVGFSGGGPFALACAHALGARISSVSLAGATDEIAHPRFDGKRAGWIQHLMELAAADSEGAIATFGRAIESTDMVDGIIAASSPRDASVYGAAVYLARFRIAAEDATKNGRIETAREVVLGTATRWPFDIAAIETPAVLWYGEHDWNPGHSPDLGRGLAELLPRCDLRVFSNEGGSILWTRSAEIIAAALDLEGRS